jgi:thioredoxin reductase
MGLREWDVVIAGAGPAGLSAALILGRACRRVLLADTGTPRSWASKAMYGFLSRDGIPPGEFRDLAHRELARYPNVTFLQSEVVQAQRRADGRFEVTLRPRRKIRCRKLLIATGVFDQLPEIDGIEHFFGKSVFQCPYCDGWELRDQAIAVYGKGQRGFEMSRAMTAWSRKLTLCTDGRAGLSQTDRAQLAANGIGLIEERIRGLVGEEGHLEHVVFHSGRTLPCAALFFDMPSHSQSRLAESIGCEFTPNGGIKCGRYEATNVPGVFVAGNIIKDVQLSIVAAAEGARAAFGINRALTREEFQARANGRARLSRVSARAPAP